MYEVGVVAQRMRDADKAGFAADLAILGMVYCCIYMPPGTAVVPFLVGVA